MSDQLVILLNGVSQLQYDRRKPLVAHQQKFLEKMNAELQQGVTVNDQKFPNPDMQHRAQFVAINLIQAVQNGEEQKAAALCAYLAVYLPDLKQVNAEQNQDGVLIDLIFDKEFVQAVKVQLTSASPKSK